MKHIEKTLPFSVHNSVGILKLFLLTGCNFNAFYVLLNVIYKTKEIIIYGLIWCAENPPFSLPMPCQIKKKTQPTEHEEETTHEEARNEKATF